MRLWSKLWPLLLTTTQKPGSPTVATYHWLNDYAICCSGLVERTIGSDHLKALIARQGANLTQCGEVGRWVSEWPHPGIGRRLVAGAWALTLQQDLRLMVTAAGTHRRQDKVLQRIGFKVAPDLPLYYTSRFDDHLRVLYFEVGEPTNNYRGLVEEMTAKFSLPSLQAEQNNVA